MILQIRFGQKNYDLEIDAGDSCEVENRLPRTLGELRDVLVNDNNLDPTKIKLICSNKTIDGPADTPLSSFKFKNNEKLLVMGRKMQIETDPVFRRLCDFEKQNLEKMPKIYDAMGVDLKELEKNFLSVAQRLEMVKRMDKRVKQFTETGMEHLEALDAMNINSSTDSQTIRNREKRKSLIDGINELLNLNDIYVMKLEELRLSILEEDRVKN